MWHKYIPNVQVFLAVNNLTYMVEIVYLSCLWLKSDCESYDRFKQKKKKENSILGAFSCDHTVVANDIIMQRTQRCLVLSETRQLDQYLVIWQLRPEGPRSQPACYRAMRTCTDGCRGQFWRSCTLPNLGTKCKQQYLPGLGSNTFYQIQIQIQIHLFPEFQIQIQIQIHRQKSDQIQIQIQIQLIKYKYKYKYTMRPRQNCRHFTDDILKFIVL